MGLAVGGASLTVASLVAEPPAGNTPPSAPQVTAPVAAADLAVSEAPVGVAAMPDTQDIGAAPRVEAPQVEVTQPMFDTTSAAVPTAEVVAEVLTAPDAALNAPELSASAEEPVLPNPQSLAPQAPDNEADLLVSTTPAAAPEPEAVVALIEDAPIQTPTVDIPVPTPTPQPDIMNNETAPQVTTAPAVTSLLDADSTGASMPTGVGSVKVNRIASQATEQAEPAADETAIPDDAPAIVRYAAAFENAENKPLMSIILLDDGLMKSATMALKTLPFSVTVVIDPSTTDAAELMAAYRAAGIEVGVRSSLPAGAGPSDVEVAFEATFGTLDQSVLLFDAGEGGLQNDRAVIDQALSILATDGRGLVSVSSGLNSAIREAGKLGVPAGVVYYDLDGQGQDARVIRRFMDQAAFRARQESGVILLARIRPETISALQLWGTANRSGQVALAPVSALLTQQK